MNNTGHAGGRAGRFGNPDGFLLVLAICSECCVGRRIGLGRAVHGGFPFLLPLGGTRHRCWLWCVQAAASWKVAHVARWHGCPACSSAAAHSLLLDIWRESARLQDYDIGEVLRRWRGRCIV